MSEVFKYDRRCFLAAAALTAAAVPLGAAGCAERQTTSAPAQLPDRGG